MKIETIQTGYTKVSPAVPDRSTSRSPIAYTGIFQKRKDRITVPVKCFYVEVKEHRFLIDSGWSQQVVNQPVKHLGMGLYFASEPLMKEEEAAVKCLEGKPIDRILMTHLDCDHISGVHDFSDIPVYASQEELDFAGKKKIRYGKLLDGISFVPIHFEKDESAPFEKACDIYGDGSVIAYLTPTHSAGSIIYKIVDETGYALVVGDNGYQENSWKEGRLPGPLYHAENMRKCLGWIKQCSEDEKCRGIFCAHDPILRAYIPIRQ